MSYKVFLTKSSEAAYAIAHGYNCNTNGTNGIQSGCADEKGVIPAIYHNKGYFYCAVEHENIDGSEVERYELIVC